MHGGVEKNLNCLKWHESHTRARHKNSTQARATEAGILVPTWGISHIRFRIESERLTKPRIYCLSRGRINRMRHEYSSSVIEISQIFHSIRRWTVLLSISISRLPFVALESYNKEEKSDRMWQFTASFVIERRSSVGWQLSDDRNINAKRGFSNKIYGHSVEVERKNWVSISVHCTLTGFYVFRVKEASDLKFEMLWSMREKIEFF